MNPKINKLLLIKISEKTTKLDIPFIIIMNLCVYLSPTLMLGSWIFSSTGMLTGSLIAIAVYFFFGTLHNFQSNKEE